MSDAPDTTDISWLPYVIVGGGVAAVGTLALAALAGKKALELAPRYAAYERAGSDEERAARAQSLVREALGEGRLAKHVREALGLEGGESEKYDLKAAREEALARFRKPNATATTAVPQVHFRVKFKDPYFLRDHQGLSKAELSEVKNWLKYDEYATIDVDTSTMTATVVPVTRKRGTASAKFKVTLKDPDALHDALDRLSLSKEQREALWKLVSDKWFQWGEYVDIEIDPRTATARVVPVSETR